MRRGALAVVLVGACASTPPAAAPGPRIDLALPALDGGTVELSRYRGKPVVLHLFATWEATATADVDQLVELHHAHGDDITIVGIALDPDGHRLVAPWRRALSVPYLVALASQRVRSGTSALGAIDTVPTTIVLDDRGRVLRRIERPLEIGEAAGFVRLVPERRPG